MIIPQQVSDGESVIAVCLPYHHGDVLWGVPCARAIAGLTGCKVDWWISPMARNCRDLLEAQSFARRVVVDEEISPLDYWMSNAERPHQNYKSTWQWGFRPGTLDIAIPDYYCRMCGLPPMPHQFDLPVGYEGRSLPKEPFVCMAPKPDHYTELFRNVVKRCQYPVVEVGMPGTTIATDLGAIDRMSDGFLEMTWVISKCRWFFGQISAPLVVASGFPCTKIAVHDGLRWDMRHVIYTDLHHYPVVGYPPNPDPEPILRLIRGE